MNKEIEQKFGAIIDEAGLYNSYIKSLTELAGDYLENLPEIDRKTLNCLSAANAAVIKFSDEIETLILKLYKLNG